MTAIDDLFSLAGRTALVTGGSRGIGRMIAAGFLRAGARVFISSRKAEACNAAAAELAKLGPCTALPADVSTPEGVRGLVAALAAHTPYLDMNRLARDHGDEVAKRVPAGRIGTDEDMAGAAIYLASRAGDYVVGATLVVDGGVTFARG